MTAARTLVDELPVVLTTHEVADLLRMTDSGVRKLVEHGCLEACGKGARGILLFRRGEVVAWIERGRGGKETSGRNSTGEGQVRDPLGAQAPQDGQAPRARAHRRSVEPVRGSETPRERGRRMALESKARRSRKPRAAATR